MNCPECGGKTTVMESRKRSGGSIKQRRRKCIKCGMRFTTRETIWKSNRKKTDERKENV